jgi:hypothetical protein
VKGIPLVGIDGKARMADPHMWPKNTVPITVRAAPGEATQFGVTLQPDWVQLSASRPGRMRKARISISIVSNSRMRLQRRKTTIIRIPADIIAKNSAKAAQNQAPSTNS